MKNKSPLAGLLLLLGCVTWAHAGGASLPRSTPEAEGISSQAIVDFVEAADKNVDTFDSFIIVRHGQVVAEGWWKPNSPDQPHVLHSVSKSFTSTAVGLAIDSQKLSLDDLVLKFFPADAPQILPTIWKRSECVICSRCPAAKPSSQKPLAATR